MVEHGAQWELSLLGVDLLWTHLGLGEPPVVLQLRSHGRTDVERGRLLDAEAAALTRSGVLRRGEVHPELAFALTTLHRPENETDLRTSAGYCGLRALGATASRGGTLAVRHADTLHVQRLRADQVTAAIVAALPELRPGEPAQVNAPSPRLAEALSAPGEAERCTALRQLGCTPRDARTLSAAFASPLAQATFGVAHRSGGRRHRAPRLVEVHDTVHGRYLVTSTGGADSSWTTVRPAAPGSVAAAVEGLRARAPSAADSAVLRNL